MILKMEEDYSPGMAVRVSLRMASTSRRTSALLLMKSESWFRLYSFE